ncbi:MAG TPA: ATP-binding protein [Methylomirabilota bacterium]|nr:ATP-binding protein [Methylomirabilota bacterium]
MTRAAAVRTAARRRPRVDATRRLQLAEAVLGTDDVATCAERALEWLHRATGICRGVCLFGPAESATILMPIATVGVGERRIARFALDLEARDHPLVAATLGSGLVVFGANGRPAPTTPLDASRFTAVPLHGRDSLYDLPVGLLLLSPVEDDARDDVAWVASILGPRLTALRSAHRGTESERRLRRERTLLYSIINAVTDPILLTDTEGRIIVANARAEALLAASEDESEGRRRAVALNNMLFSSALSRRAFGDSEPWRHELLLVDPSDGSDLLFELLSTITVDPREGTGIVSILRNVTDLRRATEEIEENYRKLRLAEADARAERDRLDLIIDSVADPILVTDPNGNIVMMNAPAERLFTAELSGSEETRRAVQANDAHFSSFVSNLFFEAGVMRRSGAIGLVDPRTGNALPVEAISGKIVSEHGEVTAMVTILHDRTEEFERARLYEQLKRASEELEQRVQEATAELSRQNELLRRSHIEVEQASAAKSQFLANMSHEFRTPLNAILGYTSMLLKGVAGEMTPHQRRNLERVDSNAHHLLAIINDILDISRIEAGKMPLTVTAFAMRDLITEVLAEVEPIIARSRLAVTSRLPDDLPLIKTDRQKVKQIVINFLTNAIKFTSQGSVEVAVRYLDDTESMTIAVADTGIGISTDDQERIFEDFRQADNSPTREYTGAGLGLAICRRLAAMLDGRIVLDSEVGRGSTFTLSIPREVKRT